MGGQRGNQGTQASIVRVPLFRVTHRDYRVSSRVKVGPMDAGTDNGFTFTAPNWPSDPIEKIFRITSHSPNHPANSFYYPELPDLPPIATFIFVKVSFFTAS